VSFDTIRSMGPERVAVLERPVVEMPVHVPDAAGVGAAQAASAGPEVAADVSAGDLATAEARLAEQGGIEGHMNRYSGDISKCPYLGSMGAAGIKLAERMRESAASEKRGPTMAEILAAKKAKRAAEAETAAVRPEPAAIEKAETAAHPKAETATPEQPRPVVRERPEAAAASAAQPVRTEKAAEPAKPEPVIVEAVLEKPRTVTAEVQPEAPVVANVPPVHEAVAAEQTETARPVVADVEAGPAEPAAPFTAEIPLREITDEPRIITEAREPSAEAEEQTEPIADTATIEVEAPSAVALTEENPAETDESRELAAFEALVAAWLDEEKTEEPATTDATTAVEAAIPAEAQTAEEAETITEEESLTVTAFISEAKPKLFALPPLAPEAQKAAVTTLREITLVLQEVRALQELHPAAIIIPAEGETSAAVMEEAPKTAYVTAEVQAATERLEELCTELFTRLGLPAEESAIRRLVHDMLTHPELGVAASQITDAQIEQGTHERKTLITTLRQHLKQTLQATKERLERFIELSRHVVPFVSQPWFSAQAQAGQGSMALQAA
jgi:hypothetical protein